MTRFKMELRWGLALLLAVELLGVPSRARGQALNPGMVADAIEPRSFGTSSTISHTLQAYAFVGFSPADVINHQSNGFGSRFCISACFYEAPLFLPAGALVTAMELEACDTSATSGVQATLFQSGKLESSNVALGNAFTGLAPTPGCVAVTGNLPAPHTIDNFNNVYFVQVSALGAGAATRFQAVRVLYNLQVSPAPAVATFSDVPTGHPFFQFVEALVASGITVGCGGGLYCVNNPITRGELAVFLGKALGLHFAP